MVSAVFMFLGCCVATVPVSQAWWWQLPMLDRLRQGQPLIPWEDPGEFPVAPVDQDNVEKLKILLMGQPKRAFTLFSGGTSDPVAKMIKGKMGKLRKPEGGRPRGHPLRWG